MNALANFAGFKGCDLTLPLQQDLPQELLGLVDHQAERDFFICGHEESFSHRLQALDFLRPCVDSRLVRFVDDHSPLKVDDLQEQGFDSATEAVLFADLLHSLQALSFDPAKTFIAAALELIERPGSYLSEVVLRYGALGLSTYRYTYHPLDELRLQAELDRLRVQEQPFASKQINHISHEARIRILEQLANILGLLHPRLLRQSDFATRLPGWQAELMGLFGRYKEAYKLAQPGGYVIDYMFDELNFHQIDALPPLEQLRLYGQVYKSMPWTRMGTKVKLFLLTYFAQKVGVENPRMLGVEMFQQKWDDPLCQMAAKLYLSIVQQSIGTYDVLGQVCDAFGVPQLTPEQEVKRVKLVGVYDWGKISREAQLLLINEILIFLPGHNGITCPHLRSVKIQDLHHLSETDLGRNFSGLYHYYRKKTPEDYDGSGFDYMLDQLGAPSFDELDFNTQCQCVRYHEKIPYKFITKVFVRRLLEKLIDICELPHLRFLNYNNLIGVVIPELDQTLEWLYHGFKRSRDLPDTAEVLSHMLDWCGVERLEKLPLGMQIEFYTAQNSLHTARWRRAPDDVIRDLLARIAFATGSRDSDNVRPGHFFDPNITGTSYALAGFYKSLAARAPDLPRGIRPIDWAFERFKVPFPKEIENMRARNIRALDDRDLDYLMAKAKTGDRRAMDHLIWFYEPMIGKIARRVYNNSKRTSLTHDTLVQIGRVVLFELIQSYDSNQSIFRKYAYKIIYWRLYEEAMENTGLVQGGYSYHRFLFKIYKTHQFLRRKIQNRNVTDQDVAAFIGMDYEKFQKKLALSNREISMDAPVAVNEEHSALFGESVVDRDTPDQQAIFIQSELQRNIMIAMQRSRLSAREILAMKKYYMEGLSLAEIGIIMDVTESRISQILKEARQKLSKGPQSKILREYLQELS